LTINCGKTDYIRPERPFNLADSEWLSNVDAAKLLQHLFSDMSEEKEKYRKVEHSLAITSWLIANDKDSLQEVLQLLKTVLGLDQ
jgi:hypothetical protein